MDTENYSAERLREQLAKGAVKVTFLKKGGTERIMNCTTNFDLIPSEYHPTPKPEVEEDEFTVDKPVKASNPDLFRIFEFGGGWKSFNISQVISVTE